ncbi:MAG TPA: hypothetical protein VGI17_00705 [Solirubrobacterales bacterium]
MFGALIVLALLFSVPALARSRQIYFWANLGSPVSSPVHGLPNPPVVRPKTLVIFEDGQWIIEKLRWTGWGSPVARAKGLSSSSNGDPNAEQGKRIITPAGVTLTQPGVFRGRRVYRCIRIKVPRPAHYPPACLQRTGKVVGLTSPGAGTPVGVPGGSSNAGLTSFLSPDKNVWCLVEPGRAFCGAGGPSGQGPELAGTLEKSGRVTLCSVQVPSLKESCFQNWDSSSPVLHYGETTEAEGIRCTSAKDGITCVKVAGARKGHGFRVNKDEAIEVGADSAAESAPPETGPPTRSSGRRSKGR